MYEYMDGFSPNLNKHLHVGHLSNFVIAKALQHMEVTKHTIAILGDTLDGSVDSQEALESYLDLCTNYNYHIDDIHYASIQKLKDESLLHNGTNDYKGTKVFHLPSGDKIVGIKESGSTTYFYQDVALAEHLNGSTLYVTGSEQNNHFNQLNSISHNEINHCGLGLVLIDGVKMSSSKGNVIFLSEMFDKLDFDDDQLKYNIMAGQFLKSNPGSNKNVELSKLSNPKTSVGLYLSYTTARLYSAGLTLEEEPLKGKLEFLFLKSQKELNPSILLKELEVVANSINKLYLTHTIKDNTENQIMFKKLGDQLVSGMMKLGMYNINKV